MGPKLVSLSTWCFLSYRISRLSIALMRRNRILSIYIYIYVYIYILCWKHDKIVIRFLAFFLFL